MPVRNVDGESAVVARKYAHRGFIFFLSLDRDLGNGRVNVDGWYSLGLLFSSCVAPYHFKCSKRGLSMFRPSCLLICVFLDFSSARMLLS